MRGPKRELISRCYNLILRGTLATRFSDAQCGFKAIRADVATKLLPHVSDTGWFFDTELLVLAERSGLRIHEVPVDWVDDPDSRVDIVSTAVADLKGDRAAGPGLRAGRIPVAQLRQQLGRDAPKAGLLRQLVRFAAVGVVSTLAYLVLFSLLRSGLGAQGANFVALGLTAIGNTAANRRYTFGVRGREGAARHQFEGLIVFGLGLALTSGSLAHPARDDRAGPGARAGRAGLAQPRGDRAAVPPPSRLGVPPAPPDRNEHTLITMAKPQAAPAHAAPAPRKQFPWVLVLLAGTAVLYLWNLTATGWANSYYAAATQAAAQSWKAWLFGSLDAGNVITVDKPPASLWLSGLFARVFGFSSWTVLAPQALCGVAAVWLLYAAVKRTSGKVAGLLAGTALALTPVATLMFRYNLPDPLLVLLLVAAAYATVRAVEKASVRWLMLAGTAVGFAFLTKMMQGFLTLPALGLVYLLAAPTSLG